MASIRAATSEPPWVRWTDTGGTGPEVRCVDKVPEVIYGTEPPGCGARIGFAGACDTVRGVTGVIFGFLLGHFSAGSKVMWVPLSVGVNEGCLPAVVGMVTTVRSCSTVTGPVRGPRPSVPVGYSTRVLTTVDSRPATRRNGSFPTEGCSSILF